MLFCCEDLLELEEEQGKGKLKTYGCGGERRDIFVKVVLSCLDVW